MWGDSNAALATVAGQLVPMVTTDPLLQRLMVAIVVNPDTVAGVNSPGAIALQSYLISAPVQAKVYSFREPGFTTPTFWPAGVSDVIT
jgi:ABC-type tungstate transport system permease subunit